jgi:excisionase family DNA binding protein
MQRFFAVTSAGVYNMVKTLERHGLITRTPRRARSIAVAGGGRRVTRPSATTKTSESGYEPKHQPKVADRTARMDGTSGRRGRERCSRRRVVSDSPKNPLDGRAKRSHVLPPQQVIGGDHGRRLYFTDPGTCSVGDRSGPTRTGPLSTPGREDVPRFDTLWTPQEVANYLRVSRSWVYQKAEAGLLPSLRFAGCLRFEPEAVKAYARGESLPTNVVPLRTRR